MDLYQASFNRAVETGEPRDVAAAERTLLDGRIDLPAGEVVAEDKATTINVVIQEKFRYEGDRVVADAEFEEAD